MQARNRNAEAQRRYKERNPEAVRRASSEHRLRCRKWLSDFKMSLGGCVDCGYNEHTQALDFDHLPGTEKKFDISRNATRRREVLLAEIAKCELVCANCHRIRTVTRLEQTAMEITGDNH